ncbi:exopolyphosphatase/guanosine-5'-triphosphate,3'-diphosphate pyrophosphatase [Roseivirga ehrenbergii]|uniref:Phosphatase n=1 Tax=Roseivirga ehrenbergii (strain DSM 102268 / JCM 13514 / KCTC 12282 / NCIMB 14502 / KMM 6017) TaxID=279360 RepID=A0A150X7F7_ROSEK|nr:phosphatase [Roseivirga ehrenbergii]KYG74630.1 phosphatase [Roseivirga ehrenbergii]TCL14050.1 exopolyphosphatase/guanosine-5'-triphosphate,3'-diphosphate pyrophosphatase [Roseivirga ehrenbergii]
MSSLRLAAIDIGSNAIRFQVTNVLSYEGQHIFKKLEYVRFPLRLGQDVFTLKKIGPEKEDKFLRLMHAFKLLIDLYEVEDYYACATSAMREAENGYKLAEKVNQLLGLKIRIISGDAEAELINKVVLKKLDNENYLHIDVGGGSTELNLISNGKKVASQSFKVGSVRSIEQLGTSDILEKIDNWVKANVIGKYKIITAIGTGGNINKTYELANKRKIDRILTLKEVLDVQSYVAGFTLEERIHKLQLNPDRADVIIPASHIYMHVMKSAKCRKILVPDVGLKDGIMHMLYERNIRDSEVDFK